MSDYNWAWGGGRSGSRTSNSRSSTVNQRRNNTSTSVNYDYSGTGLPDDRTPSGDNRYLPLRQNVNAWNNYVSNSKALEDLTEAAINNGVARYSNNQQYVVWDRQADLNRARALRAQIEDYRNDQSACDSGNANACSRVGRRDAQDRAYYNPNQESYRNYFLHNNRENPNASRPEPPAPPPEPEPQPAEPAAEPAAEPPSDIMGGGDDITPDAADTYENKKARCINAGNRWTDDAGGACFSDDTRPVPRPPERTPEPDSEVHTDEPAERTGDQVPDCPEGGRRNLLGVLDSHCHERTVNPTAQGGGSHSGKDGSKSMAGSEEVVHFDTGGKQKTLSRQENPVRQMINLIGALEDPYGQFTKCKSEKRIVE